MNNFPVILPSNTPTYSDNQPNKFRVNLPRPLEFSGNWMVGLHSITYDYSWYNMGTLEDQWIQIYFWNTSISVKLPLRSATFNSAEQLEIVIPLILKAELEKLLEDRNKDRSKRSTYTNHPNHPEMAQLKEPEKAPDPIEPEHIEEEHLPVPSSINFTDNLEKDFVEVEPPPPTNFHYDKDTNRTTYNVANEIKKDNVFLPMNFTDDVLRKVLDDIKFVYLPEFNKFKVIFFQKNIRSISLSPQLGYVLGFKDVNYIVNNEIAKYSTDLKGGINTFGVYAKGLAENVICGHEMVSLLRVVSITGNYKFGDTVEQIYDSPMFLKVLPKRISNIEIELRTMNADGRVLPFQYGTTYITLLFKKTLTF